MSRVSAPPAPSFDVTSVAVGAEVRPRLQELVDEIAVRAMDLDAIEARVLGVLRTGREVLHDAGDLARLERARRLDLDAREIGQHHLALVGACRG